MARSTRESILTAAAELMRHKGYGAVGMKDIAAASGAPIGSLYHHFRGGKVQIAREALINAGHAYALLIPSIVDEYTDVGDAIDGVFTQAAEDMALRLRTCARWPASPPRSPTPSRNSAKPPLRSSGLGDGGPLRARGLVRHGARGDARPDRRAGGCFRSGSHTAQHWPLLAAARALGPQYRGVGGSRNPGDIPPRAEASARKLTLKRHGQWRRRR
jgi:AcrR family transcriptional regulator